MIIYIKQTKKPKLIYKTLSIFKTDTIEDKTIIYLPINNKTRKKKTEKVMEKLSQFFYEKAIKNVVLEQELEQNETIKNVLYSNNINILDGTRLSKFLVFNVIEKIFEYKQKNIQAGEVTLLVNENNEVNIQTIIKLAQSVKRLNIVTNNTKKFNKIAEYIYEELGMIIKNTNNVNFNLASSDIIINLDFPQEGINRIKLPNQATLINIPKNIKIKSKKFSGINIKDWKIKVPEEYEMPGFTSTHIYEASIYNKTSKQIFEQIEQDQIEIEELIGVNGKINTKEFA